ncbi:hypothetical protein [Streptosporangium sp. NPDC006007]|uniref:hypothetical protein n=1 Tax=Streptosporangium sp. NPDC006007 TaxID=3154575 RepID=UPI0033B374C0
MPWPVARFAERCGVRPDGTRVKHSCVNYVNEGVGMACGFFIAAPRTTGLCTLTHAPNPMAFLTEIRGRPAAGIQPP